MRNGEAAVYVWERVKETVVQGPTETWPTSQGDGHGPITVLCFSLMWGNRSEPRCLP